MNHTADSFSEQTIFHERLATLGHLTAGIAHELNNPAGYVLTNLASFSHYLDVVSSYITLYQQALPTQLPAELALQLQQLQRQSPIDAVLNDCRLLLNDSMDGSTRIKNLLIELRRFASPLHTSHQSVEVSHAVQSSVRLLKHELKLHQVNLQLLPQPCAVTIAAASFSQVLINLLLNAAQALTSQAGTIAIYHEMTDQVVRVFVDDSGPGIPAALREQLFTPFVTSKPTGNGLGLSICQAIIADANGRIELATSLLGGACFVVELPLAPPHDAP